MSTVNIKEIENFAKDSAHWWDESGPFAPLHKMNPYRLDYIRDQICAQFGRDAAGASPLSGLKILDIGCGGGLMSESLAKLGADVTGADADTNAIGVAKDHAKENGLDIDYRNASTDDLVKENVRYDIVVALEIIEHVDDTQKFVQDCFDLCADNGMVVFSTINRTVKSFALAKIAAEYILRWVPQGTHDWHKFVKPSELARMCRHAGGVQKSWHGIVYNPFTQGFEHAPHDLDVNYLSVHLKG